ncbi:hypothetical protein PR001_g30545, partial [Phytophthora rubi]
LGTSSAKQAKGSAAKKQIASASPKSSPVAPGTALITFPLALGLPKEFVRDLEGIFRHVAAVNLKAWQRAYPWVNQHLFYDPVEDPDVYLGHWRFWHNCRAAFFEWALHAPLRTDSDKVQRRKRKGHAVHQRLVFISLCIETWGYYNFLRRIEAPGNGTLMWWGGQTGNTTKEAKGYSCTPIQNLFKLFQKDKAAYQRKIQDAIKPFMIDKGGFTTITEMLEQTEAFNPALVEYEKRLSDKALARVAMDLTARHFVPELLSSRNGQRRHVVATPYQAVLANDEVNQLRGVQYVYALWGALFAVPVSVLTESEDRYGEYGRALRKWWDAAYATFYAYLPDLALSTAHSTAKYARASKEAGVSSGKRTAEVFRVGFLAALLCVS